jgi:Protein of unknown function (DUF1579)
MKPYMTALLIAGLLALPSIAAAQTTPDQKKLEALVGQWRIDVDQKATPLAPATKATGTQDCQWFANRHVVCRSEAKGPGGTYSQMQTLSYLPARKQYVAYTVDSLGSALVAYGQITGDTWTFTTDQPAFNIRLTLKIAAGAFTALAEFGGADGKFVPLSEVKATRVK